MQNKQKNLFKFILPMFLLLAVLLASRMFIFNTNEQAKADNVTPESLIVISNEEALSLGVEEKDLDNPCIVFNSQTEAGIYSDHTFRVVFDAAGGYPVPTTLTVNAGDSIQEPSEIPKKDGFTFLYWEHRSICDGVNRKWDFENDIVVYDLILTAKYKEEPISTNFTVKFNANGGGANPPSQVVEKNGLAKRPPDPYKAGYKFRGWFNGTTKWIFVRDMVTSDMTLIARYLKEDSPTTKYTVSFDTDGGGANPPNQILDEGSLVTKPADPSKVGYIFKGWYNSSTSQLWNFTSDVVSSNMKLVAKYDLVSSDCVIKFNANGGGANPPNQNVTVGGLVKRPPDPYRPGYKFRGWFNGTTQWIFVRDKVETDMTLIARYVKEDEGTCLVYFFYYNDYGKSQSIIYEVPYNSLLTPPANAVPPLPNTVDPVNRNFVGWSCASPSYNGRIWNFGNDRVTENLVFYATYNPPLNNNF